MAVSGRALIIRAMWALGAKLCSLKWTEIQPDQRQYKNGTLKKTLTLLGRDATNYTNGYKKGPKRMVFKTLSKRVIASLCHN